MNFGLRVKSNPTKYAEPLPKVDYNNITLEQQERYNQVVKEIDAENDKEKKKNRRDNIIWIIVIILILGLIVTGITFAVIHNNKKPKNKVGTFINKKYII